MSKKNPYDSKKTYEISEQERAARTGQLGKVEATGGEMKALAGTNAAATRGVADTTAAAVDPALERFYSPTGMSAWKRGQINTRTGATTKSFNNSLAANRMRARLAGFGYEQPAEQAGETNIENARAAALSRIPGDVEAESVPIEMQAIGQRAASGAQRAGIYGQAAGLEQGTVGEAGRLQLGEAGEYSPEQYYGTAAQQAEQEAARRGSLWKGLAKTGLGIASNFIPGGSTFGKVLGGVTKGF